jgi:flagellar basal body P-ring protein FlgI
MTDFGDLAITKGQSVPLGKWLSFTMEQAIPKVPSWELLITIENKEYNPLPAEVRLGVQNRDGTISWGGSLTVDVAALSKTSVSVSLPLQETPPQPRI